MNNEKLYQVALSFVPGIGDINTKQLISYCGSAKNIFSNHKKKLFNIPGIGKKVIDAINNKDILYKAEKEINRCEKENVQILFYTEPNYPNRLKQIIDAPPLLFFKGNTDLSAKKIVAIVGTREATEYGKWITDQLVEDLVAHNALIVSGLAYGIDIHAHKAALKNNLDTLGVMASGANIIYPSLHRPVVNQIIAQGGIITEYLMDQKPEAHQFPARNRIIAGIADAIIIIEAAEKGGALITAEIANTYNKDVFAVPGNINNNYSVGCNNLIKSHKASLITSVKDLEYIMNWEPGELPGASEEDIFKEVDFTEEEIKIVQLLKDLKEDLLIDDISWKSQIPLNQLASILLNLEFKGVIKSLPGKKYKLLC